MSEQQEQANTEQQEEITLNLTVQEVKIVLASLQELPFRIASGIINNIYNQMQK